MRLVIEAKELTIDAMNAYKVNVNLEGCDKGDVLNNFTVEDVVKHFYKNEILDEIGIEKVMDYFDLVERGA